MASARAETVSEGSVVEQLESEGASFNPALALQALNGVAENLGLELKVEKTPSTMEILGISIQEVEVIIPLVLGYSDEQIAERNGISAQEAADIIGKLGNKLAGREISREQLADLAKQFDDSPDDFPIPAEAIVRSSEELLKEAGRLITKIAALAQMADK